LAIVALVHKHAEIALMEQAVVLVVGVVQGHVKPAGGFNMEQ